MLPKVALAFKKFLKPVTKSKAWGKKKKPSQTGTAASNKGSVSKNTGAPQVTAQVPGEFQGPPTEEEFEALAKHAPSVPHSVITLMSEIRQKTELLVQNHGGGAYQSAETKQKGSQSVQKGSMVDDHQD